MVHQHLPGGRDQVEAPDGLARSHQAEVHGDGGLRAESVGRARMERIHRRFGSDAPQVGYGVLAMFREEKKLILGNRSPFANGATFVAFEMAMRAMK